MKVWLYYAKAGGGHKAPAEALAADFKNNYPEVETKLINMAEKASVFFSSTIETGYLLLSQHVPWVYALLYKLNSFRLIISIENFLTNLFVKDAIKSQLVVDAPQAIIATYFLVSPIKKALEELKMTIPVFVIVTDPYSVSPIWFYFKDLQYIVSSEGVRESGIKAGVSAENITVFRQIVNHPVCNLAASEMAKIKEKIGVRPDKKMILMLGGANGLPEGEKLLKALVENKIDAEIVAVCGTNKYQAQNFKRIIYGKEENVKIFEWVEDLQPIMASADLILSKSGAGVVWEAVLLKKPLLLTHFIFGQEQGTMEFVVKNKLGWYLTNKKDILKKINIILGGKLQDWDGGAVERLHLRPGNKDIVNFVYRKVAETL